LRKYETATIWKTSLAEAELAEEEKRLVDVITSNGGSHSDTEKWGARELAYPIKKETEGTYWFFHWTGDEQAINAIDRHLKLNESCLRFLTLRVGEAPEPVETPPAKKTAPKKEEGEE
jgi:small subunit ribosomal protein S6